MLFETYLALGITDEVEMLGLKGSKKKKGRKLDEDYMVRAGCFTWSSNVLRGFVSTAGSQAHGRERRSQSCPSNASNSEPQGLSQTIDPCQGSLFPTFDRYFYQLFWGRSLVNRGSICLASIDASAWIQSHDQYIGRLRKRH